ncbi:hypothetical protein LOTGIDRAFT_155311 [Lottia gigantea]|uniref:Major facilitator superfamily (MFS) profile domain-containing protein n=1 Tax=Lottia gigantea TaxID=225164 RepID=V3ZNF5_LOTGI|nr:hypothetical protein LOTGIDRAFT_155311 [Lottia gigantea]ESO84000.1 hypothetical protein LOTGIDRAFT_155311 [Lottia gigantea]
MKYNEILETLGEFGWYQKRIYFLTCLPPLTCGSQALMAIFILAIPAHRCQLPSEFLDTHYYPTNNVTQYYVNSTIPVDDGQWAECEQYDVGNLSTFNGMDVVNGNISRLKCNDWVYDTTRYHSTFVTEHNLICDKAMYRSHANMLFMFGKMVGSLVFGILADIIGRKKAFIIALLLDILCTMGNAFSPNVAVFFILQVGIGAFNTAVFMSAFVLGLELVGKSKRVFAGIVIDFFWVGGLFILLILAYLFRSWDDLVIAAALPIVPLIITFWFIPESTRWLVSKGRTKEAEKILRKVAEVNKVELPDELFDKDCLEKETQVNIWEMFSSPLLVIRSLILFFNWAVISMVYYGLTLNISNLSGNIYINFTISNIVEFLGYCSVLLFAGRIGRKSILCSGMVVGGAACVLSIFPALYGNSSHYWITNGLSMIGKLGVSACFGMIFIFSAELFPTVLRNSGVGLCSVIARFGSMIAPYISDLGKLFKGELELALPLIVFGICSVVAGLLALLLPETMNRNLPDTIEEAKAFGRVPVKLLSGHKICDSRKKDETVTDE